VSAYEDHILRLLKLARDPVAVVVAPHRLEDAQAFADRHEVEVREWAGCTGDIVYIRVRGEQPMGDLVAKPAPR
jgi:hypothetical protein